MERLSGVGDFVNRNRLNIARSAAAVSVAVAGAVALEKTGPFDPLASSVDTVSHIVLNAPHEAYQQLINKLPRAKTAEAAPPPASSTNPSTNPLIPNDNCNPEEIDFTPHSATMHEGDRLTFTVDACLKADFGIFVRLVEVDPLSDDNLDDVGVTSFDGVSGESVAMTFQLDCVDGGWGLPNKLVGAGGVLHNNAYSQDIGGGAQLAIEMDYNIYDATNYYDNIGAQTGAAQVSCLDAVCANGPQGSGAQAEASVACPPPSVGGVAEAPELNNLSQNINFGKSKNYTISIAFGLAAATAAITATGAAFHINHRRSS